MYSYIIKVGSVISRDLSVFTPVGVSLRALVQHGRTIYLCKAKIMYYEYILYSDQIHCVYMF